MSTRGTFHPSINDRALLANEAINQSLEEVVRLDIIERIKARQGGYEIRDEELPSGDTDKLCAEVMIIIENYLLEDEDELTLQEMVDMVSDILTEKEEEIEEEKEEINEELVVDVSEQKHGHFVTDEGTRNYDVELRKANQECDMYKEKYGELEESFKKANEDSEKNIIKTNEEFHSLMDARKKNAEERIKQMKNQALKDIKNTSVKIAIESVEKLLKNSMDKSKLDKIYLSSIEETKLALKKKSS